MLRVRGEGDVQGRRESEREWKRIGAACGDVPGRPGRREGRQAGREAGGVARWRARAPGTLPSLCRGRRRQRRRRAGPPAGWAGLLLLGQRRQAEAQVRFFSCFISFSKFSDICSDLVIILNQFIYLCHFFMEASYINPELLYKWHNFWTYINIYN